MGTSENDLCGRVVIVTGAAGGIGRAIVQSLLADGHRIAAVDKDEEALQRLTDDFQEFDSAGCLYKVVCDLGLARACEEAVGSAARHFGKVGAAIRR